jgi:hypothetical protein
MLVQECFKLLFGSPSESMLFEDEASSGETSTYMVHENKYASSIQLSDDIQFNAYELGANRFPS